MYKEDDLIAISSLSHFLFCRRRVALIYIEKIWSDNVATTEGSHLHEKVDIEGRVEWQGDLCLIRGLRLRSLRLGLIGKADMVEFHRISDDDQQDSGVTLTDIPGRWRPFPVEYKRGKLRNEAGYIAQLCAQAFCLEEMLDAPVPRGSIFFGKTRRRRDVNFDDGLRRKTEESIQQLHELFKSEKTPTAKYENKCNFCSIKDQCLPNAIKTHHNAEWYLSQAFNNSSEESKT